MLITCSSCNSKYLINSADLKPEGRMVRCAKCGLNWYQTSDVLEQNKVKLFKDFENKCSSLSIYFNKTLLINLFLRIKLKFIWQKVS